MCMITTLTFKMCFMVKYNYANIKLIYDFLFDGNSNLYHISVTVCEIITFWTSKILLIWIFDVQIEGQGHETISPIMSLATHCISHNNKKPAIKHWKFVILCPITLQTKTVSMFRLVKLYNRHLFTSLSYKFSCVYCLFNAMVLMYFFHANVSECVFNVKMLPLLLMWNCSCIFDVKF